MRPFRDIQHFGIDQFWGMLAHHILTILYTTSRQTIMKQE